MDPSAGSKIDGSFIRPAPRPASWNSSLLMNFAAARSVSSWEPCSMSLSAALPRRSSGGLTRSMRKGPHRHDASLLVGKLAQHGQCLLDRCTPDLHSPDVAEFALGMDQSTAARGGCEMDEAERLAGDRPQGAGNSGDRDCEINRRVRERAGRHGLCGLAAHGAMALEHGPRNAEHDLFCLVAVSHEAALEHVRGACNIGQCGREQAARARFGRGNLELLCPAKLQQRAHLPEQLRVHSIAPRLQSLQGRRTVALANAAMPSPRPVKPIFSLVVAFRPTLSTGRPAIRAMRVRMRSRCGPMRGASHTTVTSRCAMRPPRACTRSTAKARKRSEATPRHWGSLGGKWTPMSPSASAPRIASTSAWRTTSASE